MRTLFLLLIWCAQFQAKTLQASYNVSFGIFETLGKAQMRYETKEDQTYSIRIEAYSEGLANTLSNNRREIYESYGKIVQGRLVPTKYIKTRQNNSKKAVKIYTFDHENKEVWIENVTSIDWTKEKYTYYAQDDLLTLFFNFKKGGMDHNRTFFAVGGNKKDGRIDMVALDGLSLAEGQKKLGVTQGDVFKVIINDTIFSSEKGELIIQLDSEGICSKAILEDVLFFGDIVGTRIR